ncbi:MAG: LytR C-terminal domain-containing protein [Actinomycetota bacterium]|nr:LytR C-terminal domain-containing protein [Actinomycetota bacterium]
MRVAILVAAVVIGAVVISKGFPTFGETVPVPSHSPTQSPTGPTPTGSQSSSPTPQLTPRQQGVKIAVFNATSVAGLAGVTADQLQKNGGYVVPVVGNFPNSQITLIYYRDAQGKVDAQHLKEKFLKEGHIKHLPPKTLDVPQTVELAIVLGSDYAAANPIS